MSKRKIIQIFTHSLSSIMQCDYSSKNSNNIPYEAGWHSQLAKEIIKISEIYNVECWGMEKDIDKQLRFQDKDITYRLFPSINLKYFGEFSLELIQELCRLAESESIIIHIHRVFNYSTFTIPLLIGNTPIVVQHHGDVSCFQNFCEAKKTKSKKAVAFLLLYVLRQEWLFERISLGKIDKFFVLNDDAKDYLLSLIDGDKIEKLTMGIDFELFEKMDKIAARSLLGLDKDKKYILYSGAFVKRKGLEYLLRAMSILLRDHENYFLILKGDGYYRDDLESLAREIGIYSNIIFVPWVEKAKLPIYYNAADVCVLPSLDEGLGITAVEALACETPFIGSDVGGIPDVVRNFGMGVLIKPRDAEAIAEAILTLIDQKQELRPDRENARRYYGWEQIAKRNIEIYDELWAMYWANENHNNISN